MRRARYVWLEEDEDNPVWYAPRSERIYMSMQVEATSFEQAEPVKDIDDVERDQRTARHEAC